MTQIPMSSPDLTQADRDAVNTVLHTPILSIGQPIGLFQEEVSNGLAD